MGADIALPQSVSGVVVVLLVDLLKAKRSWGWLRLAQGSLALKHVAGLLFAKVMGSGHEGGFVLRPSPSHQGLVLMFDQRAQAEAFLNSELCLAYKKNAREWFSATLMIDSSRGSWNQVVWHPSFNAHAHPPVTGPEQLPIATITRASIRSSSALAFWRYAPAAQADLQTATGCLLAMGLGEAPLLRQCTFSIWKDTASMVAYAQSGAHHSAIQAAYKHGFFSESMFVRMKVLSMNGHWQGCDFASMSKLQVQALAHA
jgi:spheroidene monooxygenase